MNSESALQSPKDCDGTNQQEVIGTAMKDFFSMMNEDGPVVRALLLKADGSVVEVDYDSTPKKDNISKILGGAPTILGELPGQLDGVILTKKLTPDPLVDSPNQNTILSVYGEVLGDVFVTRLDENIEPKHFGLSEFKTWESSRYHRCGNIGNKVEELEEVDLDDEKEFDWEAEDTDEDEADVEDVVMQTVINAYMAKNGGKVPTAEEVEAILAQMGFNVVGELSEEEERELLIVAYEKEHGIKPTHEQLDQMMLKLPRYKTAHLLSEDFPLDDDDEDWEPPHAENERLFEMKKNVATLEEAGDVSGKSMETSVYNMKLSAQEEMKNLQSSSLNSEICVKMQLHATVE